ncbi:hypothetical protein MMC34_005510 [Xylographa carneopallida]|nr:hypothetical protein [Xylographa carneopallida]
MVSVKRGVQEVEGQWWWARSSRLSSPRRRTRNSVGGKVEKGSVTALGKSNEFVDRWSTALARIHTPNANQVSESSTEDSMSTLLVVEQDPSAIDNKDSIEYWVKSTRRHKIRTWEGKLISSLREKPPDILKILSANLESSGIFLPGRVVKDCLNHLAWLYLNTSTYTSSVYFEAIYRVVVNSLEIYREDSHSIALDQRTIRLLSKHCDADQLILFLEKLNKSAAFIHTNTRLHIMPKLVEYGKIGLALSMLKHMPPQDLLLDKVQMFCVKLLRANLEVEDLYRLRSNVLAFILEAGVRPNRFLANIIILNANEAGDLSTAWRSHTIAKENGLVPDAATYTALLKGVHHPNSQSTVRLVYRDAKLDGCLSKSSRLKFELLYALYISNSGKHNETPYSNLLPYYRQFFDIKPLQELGIIHSTGSSDEEEGQFSEPVVQALGLILLAWLIESHDNRKVLAVYERYRYHTQHNHSLIAQLAETEHTANAFTVAFGRSPRTVHICTQVVQDMLKAQVVRIDESHVPPSTSDVSHSDNDGIENIVEDSSLQHTSNVDLGNYKIRHIASPNVQTWSILLFAFVKHRQFNAAEKVLALMEARGQQPNIVTWNSLLSGYARLQDFPGIISTMERINQAGLATDEWTSKALARVVDRDLLLQTLEENTQKDINDMNGKQAMASI